MVILSKTINTSTLTNQPVLFDLSIALYTVNSNINSVLNGKILDHIGKIFEIEQDSYTSFSFVELPSMIMYKLQRGRPVFIHNRDMDVLHQLSGKKFGVAHNIDPDTTTPLYTSQLYHVRNRLVLYVPVKNPDVTIVKL